MTNPKNIGKPALEQKDSSSSSEMENDTGLLSKGKVDLQVGINTSFFYKLYRHISGGIKKCDSDDDRKRSIPDVIIERASGASNSISEKGSTISEVGCRNKLLQSIKDLQNRFLGNNTLNRSKPNYYRWLTIVSIAITYNCVLTLARISFSQLNSNFSSVFIITDYISDLIYILDIYIKCRTSFMENGMLIEDPKKIFVKYAKSDHDIMMTDVLSILPVDHICRYFNIIPKVYQDYIPAALRLNRCLKYYRFTEFLSMTETKTKYPNFFRIAILFLYILVVVHYNACLWFGFSRYVGLKSDDWVYPPKGTGWSNTSSIYQSLSRQYIFSLYWSTLTLTSIGEFTGPINNMEYIFQLLDFLGGVLIFASIVGNVGTMIAQANAQKTQFQCKVDSIKQYMHIRHVSPDLQAKVIKWFDYLWREGKTVDEEAVLKLLPDKLRADVALNVHLDTLSNVALFKDTEPGFLLSLVLKLKPKVFSPQDFVCKKGDIGREMYIVKEGELEVVSEDLSKRFCVLKSGSYMGELSILDIPGRTSGNRRTAHVRAIGYCDLFALSGDDLNSVMNDYPEAKRVIIERGQAILRKDNLLNEDLIKSTNENSRFDLVYLGNKCDKIECQIDQIQTMIHLLQDAVNKIVREDLKK